jgi:hypothetical protein
MKVCLLAHANSGSRRSCACILQSRFAFQSLQFGKHLVCIDAKKPFDIHAEHLEPVAKCPVKAPAQSRRLPPIGVAPPTGARILLKQPAKLFRIPV